MTSLLQILQIAHFFIYSKIKIFRQYLNILFENK
jgi:hypothetical protein